MIEEVEATCPYCGESIGTTVDCSGGSAQYFEDCPVCCRPIRIDLRVGLNGGLEGVSLHRDDD
ncbi:MAG: CPXCG motif-containing cysteine-rich protein [Gammaproteobacteria bacterium]|nr:CPXCG motif-containing cysteine-rich protein [Gammaproteobacteria bacterium]